MTTAESALLLIDLQNDFFSGGRLAVPNAERIITPTYLLLSAAQEIDLPIFASRDWHPRDSIQFVENGGPWPTHCIAGSHGAEFHESLPIRANASIIDKGTSSLSHGYSAFEGAMNNGRSLADELSLRALDSLFVAGLATDYCVMQTVLDARRCGFNAILVEDAIAAVEKTPGDGESALAKMRDAGASLISSGHFLSQFQQSS